MSITAPSPLLTKLQGTSDFLRAHNVERNEEIDLLLLSMVSGVDALLLGEPGVGKTWLIELLFDYCLSDMELFTILLAKDMSADEVLGPRDIMAMKQGLIKRLTDGFLPKANGAYVDEVFKASPPLLNPLLDIGANRKLKVGGKVLDLSHLIFIQYSSNELPDREDLLAFRDRIGITKFVAPPRTPEGRRAVTDIQLDFQANGIDASGVDPLTLDDIHAIRAEIKQVQVGEAVRQVMVEAQQKLLDAGHPPSPRRIGQCWKIIKARAWSLGRDEVAVDDFLPCQHMWWNHPDDAASAREIVLEFASVFTRKAARLREAMEPVVAELESLKQQLDGATEAEKEDMIDRGWKFLRQLKKLHREGAQQVKEGKSQGQDTSIIEEVVSDIKRYDAWAESALSGVDADDDDV